MSFTCWNQTCLTVQNRREYTIGPYFYFSTINLNEKLEKAKISEMVVEKSFESKACLGYSYLFCQDKIIVRKKITLGDTELGRSLFSSFLAKTTNVKSSLNKQDHNSFAILFFGVPYSTQHTI